MSLRPICPTCGVYPVESNGGGTWKRTCNGCRRKPYLKHRKDRCDFCGFIPVHVCQLDVDHIDGNHSNNDKSNLQTLCANCHRLKTHLNRDYLNS